MFPVFTSVEKYVYGFESLYLSLKFDLRSTYLDPQKQIKKLRSVFVGVDKCVYGSELLHLSTEFN